MTYSGKGGISAEILADSLSETTDVRLTSVALVYPGFIHDELSLLAGVSWSTPALAMLDAQQLMAEVTHAPAMPIHWGRAGQGPQAGREAKNDLSICEYNAGEWIGDLTREAAWLNARDGALLIAQAYLDEGYHHEIIGRLLAPYRMLRSVATATDWPARIAAVTQGEMPPVQPETRELLDCLHNALKASQPVPLKAFDWHLPYYPGSPYRDSGAVIRETRDDHGLTLTQALRWSAVCCALASRHAASADPEVLEHQYASLHAYPGCLAHQALCMEGLNTESGLADTINDPHHPSTWQTGVTHRDASGALWSGNFRGFIQRRQMLRQPG